MESGFSPTDTAATLLTPDPEELKLKSRKGDSIMHRHLALILLAAFLLPTLADAQRPRQTPPPPTATPPPAAPKAPPPPAAQRPSEDTTAPVLRRVDGKLLSYSTAEARKELAPLLDTPTAPVLTAFGRLLEQEKDFTASEARLRRAAEIAPGDPAPWIHLGESLARQQKADAARAAFAEAEPRAQAQVDADPQSAAGHYALGVARRGLGRNAPAQASLERARDLAPGDPMPRYQLGVLFAQTERWRDAVDSLTQALDRDEAIAYAYFYRGQAAAQVGNKNLLIADLRRFLTLAPDAPEAAVAARILRSAGR